MAKIKKNSTNENDFNTLISLDFLLSDILKQIKIVPPEEKDAPYTKLIELFFKGIDLMGKLHSPNIEDSPPQNNFIQGVEEDKI
jgi:hypothetical protein